MLYSGSFLSNETSSSDWMQQNSTATTRIFISAEIIMSPISQFASSKQPCVYCLQLLLLHRYTSSLYSAIINQCCEQNSMSLGHFAILWLPKTSLTVVCVIQCLTTINFVIHSAPLQISVYLWTIVCTYRKQNRTSSV